MSSASPRRPHFIAALAALAALPLTARAGGGSDEFTAEQRAWWAVQAVADPRPPGGGHPVDAFVARRLAEAELQPAPAAEGEELARRIHFDLVGLPPTPEEVRDFTDAYRADAEGAVAGLVDALLASPRYGERWAGHWLDVVRYAESDGYREDKFRPDAHRYRDYVVRAFNADKPYDQFVREQLAADELAPGDPDVLEATGFLRLGIYEWNQRNAEMQHRIMVDEMTRVTGETFLGLGIGCAQCHDHKFDPILQRDYYGLQAFLSSVAWPRDRKLGTRDQLAARAAWEARAEPVREAMDALLADARAKYRDRHVATFPPEVQAMYRKPHAEQDAYERQIALLVQWQVDREEAKVDPGKALEGAALERYRELAAEWEALAEDEPKLPTAFVATDSHRVPAATHIDGDPRKAEVGPALLALLGQGAPGIEPTPTTTGRRTALADWIASADNPFTVRVYVNRVWQHHFGTGLVATPNDFGTLGEPPSHPELLDWLATRFVEGGWRTKPLHRLIMTSAAYRRTARAEPGERESTTDPGNRLLWRFSPARLSAEQVRDAMLAVSGELRHRDAGGASAGGEQPVRSLYVKRLRNAPDEVLQCFDAPAGFDSSPDRAETTTPTQALLLANSDWPLARARAFAERVLGGDKAVADAHLERAYAMAWGRAPTSRELAMARDFIAAQRAAWAGLKPPEPEDRFPDETGLRPIAQRFAGAGGQELGGQALWLQPGSRFERLQLPVVEEGEGFTVEAVVGLESLHKDASVNTVVSRWSGDTTRPGWSLGVTSEKSRYQPRNLIVQLIGENPGGDLEYEAVPSGLRVPLGKPVRVSATVSPGKVEFLLQEFGDTAGPPQTAEVEHHIVGGYRDPETQLVVGGRDSRKNGHLWDGQLAKLTLARAGGPVLLDACFAADRDGAEPVPGSRWLPPPRPAAAEREPELDAFADFCHALISSNEFLYLH